MDVPETLFARLGEDRIAYQVLGEGPPDLVLTMGGASHVDMKWEEPSFEEFHRRIATLGRLIMFDGRGSGASDPLPPDTKFAWESWVDDLGTVMDTVGSERAVIFGAVDSGPAAIMFAATRPELTAGLVLFNTTARLLAAPDYPIGLSPEAAAAISKTYVDAWGTSAMARIINPDRANDEHFCNWYAKYSRAAASPRVLAEHAEQFVHSDVRAFLKLVQAPTLVMERPADPLPMVPMGRFLADNIPDARFVELPGNGLGLMGQHVDATIAAVREFLTGAPAEPEPDRVLATVLFTDIVGSTGHAAEVGDRRWRLMLDRHDRTVRGEVERFRGHFIKSTGDGVLATFDTPTRALRCAFGLRESLAAAGLEIRAGVHTGEIELRGEDVGGIGVHIAARTASEAGPREVVVTRTVRDLATGTDLSFRPRATVELRGIPGEWELFEATVKRATT